MSDTGGCWVLGAGFWPTQRKCSGQQGIVTGHDEVSGAPERIFKTTSHQPPTTSHGRSHPPATGDATHQPRATPVPHRPLTIVDLSRLAPQC